MAKAKVKKIDKPALVSELRDSLQQANGFLLTDHTGLTVPQIQELRRRFAAAHTRYRVVKNTLLRRALDETRRAELEPHLFGATSLALIEDDPVAAAKALNAFLEEVGLPKVKGGWIEGQLLDADGVKVLATVPGRAELHARLVGILQGNVTNLVLLLQAPIRDLVMTLEAYAHKTGAGDAPAAA